MAGVVGQLQAGLSQGLDQLPENVSGAVEAERAVHQRVGNADEPVRAPFPDLAASGPLAGVNFCSV